MVWAIDVTKDYRRGFLINHSQEPPKMFKSCEFVNDPVCRKSMGRVSTTIDWLLNVLPC